MGQASSEPLGDFLRRDANGERWEKQGRLEIQAPLKFPSGNERELVLARHAPRDSADSNQSNTK